MSSTAQGWWAQGGPKAGNHAPAPVTKTTYLSCGSLVCRRRRLTVAVCRRPPATPRSGSPCRPPQPRGRAPAGRPHRPGPTPAAPGGTNGERRRRGHGKGSQARHAHGRLKALEEENSIKKIRRGRQVAGRIDRSSRCADAEGKRAMDTLDASQTGTAWKASALLLLPNIIRYISCRFLFYFWSTAAFFIEMCTVRW